MLRSNGSDERYQIFMLHSNMQTSDQKKVLKNPPVGIRKIILSTNIAETSITVNDVVFVIDSGKVKEDWRIANVVPIFKKGSKSEPGNYRPGRAKYACAGAVAEDQKRTSCNEDGRRRSGPETPIRPDQQRDRPWGSLTRPDNSGTGNIGTGIIRVRVPVCVPVAHQCAACVPTGKRCCREDMNCGFSTSGGDSAYSSAVSCTAHGLHTDNVRAELCLHTKLLAPVNCPIADFLMKAPEPPPALIVRNAVQMLKTIDAMDSWEDLTEVGYHLADLPVEPHLGKMVLCAVVLKCLDPILTIACALAYRDPFVLPTQASQKRAAMLCRKRFTAATFSDHMALLRAFQLPALTVSGAPAVLCFTAGLRSQSVQRS
ncbi:unnamed protein product [Ranitomeya imitator]|uniref:Helicase C-terminal domain-containing protein n=1 Tax=Ranitomeya imitator TaxID=111125 RepID=A0ABN9M3Q2_9NEOB|nr:unnamed protein product [Ranitomeya imitator]